MKSIKCSECGFVGWADSDTCKRCGVARSPETTDTTYKPLQPRNVTYHDPVRTVYTAEAQLKKGLAVASLVLGIVNFFTLGVLGLGIIVGVVLSIVALSKVKQHPERYGGRQLAIAGLITNIVAVVALAPVVLI